MSISCFTTGGHAVIPLSGEMGEAQKVIPFLREMSRSDKRFADVLRLPPGCGLPRAINQTLVLYQVFLREQTPVPAGGHTGPPLQKSLKLTALPLYKNKQKLFIEMFFAM